MNKAMNYDAIMKRELIGYKWLSGNAMTSYVIVNDVAESSVHRSMMICCDL